MKIEQVHLFGCGSIGTHLIANLLGTMQVEHLFLYDKDILEPRNVGHRIRLLQNIKKKKVIALKEDLILNFNNKIQPHRIYDSVGDILIKNININKDALVLDCLDNFAARQYTTKYHNVLHVGFSPDLTGTVHWNENYRIEDSVHKDDPCDMEGFYPFLSILSSVAVFSIMEYLKDNKKNNYVVFGKKVEIF